MEPTVLLTALAGDTDHIGLIATVSTTYSVLSIDRPVIDGASRVYPLWMEQIARRGGWTFPSFGG